MKTKKHFIRFIISFLLAALIYNYLPYQNRAFAELNNDVNLPEVKSFDLDNGIRSFYIKDELPQLIITISIGFGKLYETGDNAGISDLLAKTLSLAGSKKYPTQKLHQTIESIGGRIGIGSSWEKTYISLRVLKRHANLAFDIASDIIQNPNLDAGILEHTRSLLLENVRRKKDNPDMLAFEKLREIIFDGNGYGSVTEKKSLKSISKEDLLKIWDKYFKADNIIIGISSSLTSKEIKGYVESGFSNIARGKAIDYGVDLNRLSLSMKEKSKSVYLIPKDIPQATIALGTIAPTIKDTRIYSLKMMNYILGGGSFNSRLMREIRVKRGLSYAVQSIIRFRKNTGIFIAYAQTKNETTDSALSLLLENIELISKDTVSDEELKWTKESIKNSYIFEFDSPMNILNKYTFLSYNGLTDSFIEEYIKNINGVSKKMILKNGKDLFKNGLVKVIVGKRDLKSALQKYGKVIIIEQ